MSYVETLHQERVDRLARIAARGLPEPKAAFVKKYYKPSTPPAMLVEAAFGLGDEAAWAMAIMGLEDYSGAAPRRLRVEEIQSVVALHYRMARDDLLSERRFKELVRARAVAMYLARHLTLKSLPEIANFFGGRDHSTVLHAVRRVDERMRRDPEFYDTVMHLWNTLKARQ